MMLKAGFARMDITPPMGSYVSGYFSERYAKGVLDPIQLNAVAFSDGEATDLIITADLLGVDRITCDALRTEIAACTGIDRDHIMLTALHPHTSYAFLDMNFKKARGEKIVPTDELYCKMLHLKYCDVAKMALDDMHEATLGYAEEETAEQIAFVRRYYMKDGTVATNPWNRVDEIVRPCETPDNTVRLLRFAREGKNDIALVNFCTHPDVIGGEYLSADWPGFVRRYVEKDLGGVSCLLLNGCQGDSNHCDWVGGKRGGYDHAAHMGRVIADTVLKLWNATNPQDFLHVAGGVHTVVVPTRTEGAEEYDKCVRFLEDHHANRLSYKPTGAELGRAGRITRLRTAPAFQQVPVSVLRLGDFAFVGFGGEPFTHYGIAVRENCPDVTVITACCANGYEGYLPTALAFEEGGYEGNSSPFSSDLEEKCVAAATELIQTLL